MSLSLQDQSIKLEAQLSSATERLSSTQSDVAQLRQQVVSAERRAEEKEASSLQTQEKFSAIFDSLRADHEKVGGCGREGGESGEGGVEGGGAVGRVGGCRVGGCRVGGCNE